LSFESHQDLHTGGVDLRDFAQVEHQLLALRLEHVGEGMVQFDSVVNVQAAPQTDGSWFFEGQFHGGDVIKTG
jgi:hypothetical protein